MSISDAKKTKLDLEPDVCMSAMKNRYYKKIEASYLDSVEQLTDCRGDIYEMENEGSIEDKLFWALIGFVVGGLAGVYASK